MIAAKYKIFSLVDHGTALLMAEAIAAFVKSDEVDAIVVLCPIDATVTLLIYM